MAGVVGQCRRVRLRGGAQVGAQAAGQLEQSRRLAGQDLEVRVLGQVQVVGVLNLLELADAQLEQMTRANNLAEAAWRCAPLTLRPMISRAIWLYWRGGVPICEAPSYAQ